MVHRVLCGLLASTLFLASSALASDRIFESPPVHPLAMTPDGTRLVAVNTADHRVSVFDLTQGGGPVLLAEVPVGLEPVTVRARTNDEVWVVNHISDSVSILDLTTLNVKRTLIVGDEPTDVAFTASPARAFVCVSQRDLVRVYDLSDLDLAPVDVPINGSDPHYLTVSPDGTGVYVAVLESGNQTTVVPEATVDTTMGLPPAVPPMNPALPAPPKISLIVKYDGTHWVDELNRSWDAYLPYQLYDNDVVRIDAASLGITQIFQNVGTLNFAVAANPQTGRLYVSNIESFNQIRHEPALRSHFAENRVTRIDPGSSTIVPVHLNPHINYADTTGTPAERVQSVGLPLDIAVNAAGTTVYVAGFGSNNVAVLDADANPVKRIFVGPGPCGLALDEPRGRLYVLNRFFTNLSVVNLADDTSSLIPVGFDPTPIEIQVGRTFFYNTQNASGHGDVACATCHVFGNMDGLAWDLGDPTANMIPAPQPQTGPMHPMKGPLVTQAIKGLTGSLPLHWRGDRATLSEFNQTFVQLQGRATQFDPGDFALMESFINAMHYPPNPNRLLDGSLQDPPSGPNPKTGESLFFTGGLVGGSNCDFCHVMPVGTGGLIFPAAAIIENQAFEPPQLRNLYEKDGFTPTQSYTKKGFGFTHEGNEPSIFTFTFRPIFTFHNNQERLDVEAYLHRFDTGTHSAVGQQLTLDGTNTGLLQARLDTLESVAVAGDCGLIAKGIWGGVARGFAYRPSTDDWLADRSWAGPYTTQDLIDNAGPGTEMTFTAVVPGCETVLGVDRDDDGYYDRDELDAGTDPADPYSFPAVLATPGDGDNTAPRPILAAAPNPAGAAGSRIAYVLERPGAVRLTVHDAQGRLVRRLVDDPRHAAGSFEKHWDLTDDGGRGVAGGIYFVRFRGGVEETATRLVVLR